MERGKNLLLKMWNKREVKMMMKLNERELTAPKVGWKCVPKSMQCPAVGPRYHHRCECEKNEPPVLLWLSSLVFPAHLCAVALRYQLGFWLLPFPVLFVFLLQLLANFYLLSLLKRAPSLRWLLLLELPKKQQPSLSSIQLRPVKALMTRTRPLSFLPRRWNRLACA